MVQLIMAYNALLEKAANFRIQISVLLDMVKLMERGSTGEVFQRLAFPVL
jgi:hypothetical protein